MAKLVYFKDDSQMTIKSLLMIAALGLSTMFVAHAKDSAGKTYSVLISEPTTVGTSQLPRGEYRLKVDGTNATFVATDGSKKTVTATVKIDAGTRKFDQTVVVTDKTAAGVLVIHEIDLGGSTTKLGFGL
jgi:hypothetical protein